MPLTPITFPDIFSTSLVTEYDLASTESTTNGASTEPSTSFMPDIPMGLTFPEMPLDEVSLPMFDDYESSTLETPHQLATTEMFILESPLLTLIPLSDTGFTSFIDTNAASATTEIPEGSPADNTTSGEFPTTVSGHSGPAIVVDGSTLTGIAATGDSSVTDTKSEIIGATMSKPISDTTSNSSIMSTVSPVTGEQTSVDSSKEHELEDVEQQKEELDNKVNELEGELGKKEQDLHQKEDNLQNEEKAYETTSGSLGTTIALSTVSTVTQLTDSQPGGDASLPKDGEKFPKEIGNYVYDEDEEVWREREANGLDKEIDKSKMEYEKHCLEKKAEAEGTSQSQDDIFGAGRRLMNSDYGDEQLSIKQLNEDDDDQPRRITIPSLIINDPEWANNVQTVQSITPKSYTRVYQRFSKILPQVWTPQVDKKQNKIKIQDETFSRKQFKDDDWDRRIHPTMVGRLSAEEWVEPVTEAYTKEDVDKIRVKRSYYTDEQASDDDDDDCIEADDEADDQDDEEDCLDAPEDVQQDEKGIIIFPEPRIMKSNSSGTSNNTISKEPTEVLKKGDSRAKYDLSAQGLTTGDTNKVDFTTNNRKMMKKDLINHLRAIKNEMNLLRNENNELHAKEQLLRQIKQTLQKSELQLKKVKSSIQQENNSNEVQRKTKSANNLKTILNPTLEEVMPESIGDVGQELQTQKSAYTVNVLHVEYDDKSESHKLKQVNPKKHDMIINEGFITTKDETTPMLSSDLIKVDDVNPPRRVYNLQFDPEAESHVISGESKRGGNKNESKPCDDDDEATKSTYK